ncbi:MAG TPA: cytochrome c3 family protein, partial [Polyangia bacterium]
MTPARAGLALGLCVLAATAAAAPPTTGVGAPGKPAQDSCTTCHAGLGDARLRAPAVAADDVHRRQGITCAGCHGGDPRAADPGAAMDPGRGFKGRFAPAAVPELCGSCHADPAFMRRYAPNVPTDQLAQYRTSRHGIRLAAGDPNVAVCTSCHGAHGVLPAADARAPVYPTRVVATCARCHADAALMRRYGRAGTEVADYQRSVHAAALTRQNDLSAPTCVSCHGAHGATPPGVSSVANVCGSCHSTQRERFDRSPHKDAFAAMKQPACEACHGNHAVLRPADGWVGVGAGQVCAQCHAAGDGGAA